MIRCLEEMFEHSCHESLTGLHLIVSATSVSIVFDYSLGPITVKGEKLVFSLTVGGNEDSHPAPHHLDP